MLIHEPCSVEGGDGSQAEKVKSYGTLLVKLYLKVRTGRFRTSTDPRAGPPLIHSAYKKDLKGKAVDSKVG